MTLLQERQHKKCEKLETAVHEDEALFFQEMYTLMEQNKVGTYFNKYIKSFYVFGLHSCLLCFVHIRNFKINFVILQVFIKCINVWKFD